MSRGGCAYLLFMRREPMEKKRIKFYGGIWMAFIPFMLFIVSCILFFVVFQYYEMTALALGAILSLIVGSVFSKNWAEYWDAVIEGMSQPIINTVALIFLVVGIFAKMMSIGGVAEGFVWIGQNLGLSGGAFCAFTFLISCMIATATGTSFGTVFSCVPILYPAGILLGCNPAFLAGAILSGAIFGDNLAPISDTAVAGASSQCFRDGTVADVAGVVFERLKYCLVAAAISFAGFFLFGGGGVVVENNTQLLADYSNPKGLVMLLPVAILLFVAFKKRNIFIAITWGLFFGCIIGIGFGIFTPADIISLKDGALTGFAIAGVENMVGTVIYLYGIAGIMGILTSSGLMDKMIGGLMNSKVAATDAGTELIITSGAVLSGICLGSAAAPAVLMFSPIAERLGKVKNIHPYRRANLLICGAFTVPVIIPATSAFIFITVSAVQGLMSEYSFISELNPASLTYSTLHSWTLLVILLISIFTGWGRIYEGDDRKPVKENRVSG